jgi:hypothetical protein
MLFSETKLFLSLFYRFRNTYERNVIHSLENCHVKILQVALESESDFENGKNNLDPNLNPKKINSDPQH